MKIALIGYGKMGRTIEQVIKNQPGNSHQVVLKIDKDNNEELTIENLQQTDVAIEFTSPESAVDNILTCFDANVPVVSGSTGWLDRLHEVKQKCLSGNKTFFYAPNFSVGVNIFFAINERLSELMRERPNYDVEMEEVHHTEKLDSPSGTAIQLANAILSYSKSKQKWVNIEPGITDAVTVHSSDELTILSKREPDVPGTHIIKYISDVDSIEIKHTAFSRKGFAEGAVLAAEWVKDRKGYYEMKDLLNI